MVASFSAVACGSGAVAGKDKSATRDTTVAHASKPTEAMIARDARETLEYDARVWAKEGDISFKEAKRRLIFQRRFTDDLDNLGDTLSREEPAT